VRTPYGFLGLPPWFGAAAGGPKLAVAWILDER
jgi:hypothetical protein